MRRSICECRVDRDICRLHLLARLRCGAIRSVVAVICILARTVSLVLCEALPRLLMRLAARILARSTGERSALGRGQRDGRDFAVMLGQVGIQPGKMRAQCRRRVGRARHQRCMNAAGAEVGAYAHPAERWVVEAGLGALRTGVYPGWRGAARAGIKFSKGVALRVADLGCCWRTALRRREGCAMDAGIPHRKRARLNRRGRLPGRNVICRRGERGRAAFVHGPFVRGP